MAFSISHRCNIEAFEHLQPIESDPTFSDKLLPETLLSILLRLELLYLEAEHEEL